MPVEFEVSNHNVTMKIPVRYCPRCGKKFKLGAMDTSHACPTCNRVISSDALLREAPIDNSGLFSTGVLP